ncbi:Efflux pump membrane transporter BepG [BD1-7 clade bacterium]|uniref:Efflux pump membrane transporter n=1 Tax=BD1-7 clade bacterium TaxID=2029982 RepID=A0A5S9PIC2_9GAMM|nr:Efflux pump membrane transporter BepG [BD1-7 clade bacterium]CAA0103811.1 Efflux pump membrane transporter BepG [BD1-7 clade bacterium]
MSGFFLRRPKFAMVVSLVIALTGAISIFFLPISEYPNISPPHIQVSANYPGASAQVIEKTIAGPIEDAVNGVEGMLYMHSTSDNNGGYVLSVTFDLGENADMALVRVQNRLKVAEPRLPLEVRRSGVLVQKRSPDLLMIISLVSDNPELGDPFLLQFANDHVQSALARVPGVANAQIFSGAFAMRIWIDPQKMAALNLVPQDVVEALQEQNVQAALGKFGGPPFNGDMRGDQMVEREYVLHAKGRLRTVKDFSDVILKAHTDGAIVRLGDVAEVSRGRNSYSVVSETNGSRSVNMGIYLTPDANALYTEELIQQRLKDMQVYFPQGLSYNTGYNGAAYIRVVIEQVVFALLSAVVLVILITWLFLGSIRATLVPAIAIPVSLIGSFSVLLLFGISINTISLLAMIVAVGVVVDDAILVVENAQRVIRERPDLTVRQAVGESMQQITGAVIATTLVLLAVFLPVALMPGIVGQLYQVMGTVICTSVVISSINALTLSPVLCAWLLPASDQHHRVSNERASLLLMAQRTKNAFVQMLQRLMQRLHIVMLAMLVIILTTVWGLTHLPRGFIPDEDKGQIVIFVQLPDAAALPRTYAAVQQLENLLKQEDVVRSVASLSGTGLGSSAGNQGLLFVVLEPWSQRRGEGDTVFDVVARINTKAKEQIPEASIFAVTPPTIRGIGSSGGVRFVVQDLAGHSFSQLSEATEKVVEQITVSPSVGAAFNSFRANVPEPYLDIDREKVMVSGVKLTQMFRTLQANVGSFYVNDFNEYGQNYQVILQAQAGARDYMADLNQYYLRNDRGDVFPMSGFYAVDTRFEPDSVTRYNKYRAVIVSVNTKPGYPVSDAITAVSDAAQDLPPGFGYDWTGAAFQRVATSHHAFLALGLALLFIYLFLVALYESWMIPFAVLSAVPVALSGAALILELEQRELDLFAQVGLLLLLCMTAKNAILIVDVAQKRMKDSKAKPADAAVYAAARRYRAINMTSFSFICGVLPLVFASGAGAAAQQSLGITLSAGMLSALFAGVFLTPCVLVVLCRIMGLGDKG